MRYFAFGVLLLFLRLPSIQAAGAADKIRIAVPDVGGQFLTYPLAQKLGLLRQEGLDAEIILIRGNAALAALSGCWLRQESSL